MATPNVVGRIARRVALATSGNEELKGGLLATFSSVWFMLFLLLPMVIVVIFGFATINPNLTLSYQQLTIDHYLLALNPFSTVMSLTFRTILVSIVATLGSLVVAYPLAYYLARVAAEKRRNTLISLIIIPFWISFVVQVYALYPWVQRQGYIGTAMESLGLGGFADWLFDNFGYRSSNIVVPALIYIWLPLMVLPLFTSILRIDPSLLEAAQDLGAGKWKTFRYVTLPLSSPGIIMGTVLMFISAFGSFVEPKLLAGTQGVLVGNFIFDAFLKFGYLPNGAAASVIVLVPTIVLLYAYVTFAERTAAGSEREPRLLRLLVWIKGQFAKVSQVAIPRHAKAPPGLGNGYARPTVVPRNHLERIFDRIASRFGGSLLGVYALLILASLYIPMAQVVIFSFNQGTNIIHFSQFSLRWYLPEPAAPVEIRALFGDGDMMSALYNSVVIGLTSTGLSLVIGTPAALALVRYRFGFKRYLNLMLYTGLVMPSIIMGVSILVFLTYLNDLLLWPYLHLKWETGYASIIVGHVTFSIPVVIVVLLVSLREFDRSIEEAAMNLGADEFVTFFKVTLPNIMPGIISAALLAFTFSFSELVVTLFLKGGGVATLPVVFWGTLSKKIPTPELNAASTLILGMSVLFVLIANRVQRGGTLFRF